MPRGDYISKSSAMYSAKMNRELAFRLLMKAGLQRIGNAKFERQGYWGNSLLRVSGRADAVSTASHSAEEACKLGLNNIEVEKLNNLNARGSVTEVKHHVGDLRNISTSVLNLPGHLRFGNRVRKLLDTFLDDNPKVQEDCLGCIGKEVGNQFEAISEDHLRGLRNGVCDLCAEMNIQVNSKTAEPIAGELISSNICGMLLHAWALAAGDPAAKIALWIRDGAPAGIRVPLDELEGIMPKVDDDVETDCPDLLTTEYDTFVNHGSLEGGCGSHGHLRRPHWQELSAQVQLS